MIKFIFAFFKSMRLYLSFVTGLTGWVGVAYYEYIAGNPSLRTIETQPNILKKVIILAFVFLVWGMGQIINDYMGVEEDRVNAPKRPMVTGELNSKIALIISSLFMLAAILVTWLYLEPFALIFVFIGFILNGLYEFAKAHGIWGNIVYGLSETMCAPFAFCAMGPTKTAFFTATHIIILVLIVLLHFNMCYFSYFKDYIGDKAAGKNTIIVKYGPRKASVLGVIFSLLPTVFFTIFYCTGLIALEINTTFIALGLLVTFLQIYTGIMFIAHPDDEMSFESMKIATRAVTCGLAAIIALVEPSLALWLFLITYIFVGFLFERLESKDK